LALRLDSGYCSTARFCCGGGDASVCVCAIAEYDGGGALQRRFVFDPTTGQPVLWYEGTGTASTDRRYLSQDERGSVISVSDSTGASLGINTYDEYGVPGASNLGRYQYTGQKWIGEAGLYDYKARDYLPQLGIFAQTDPVGYNGDGPNLYAYVEDDPVNFVDPMGLNEVVARGSMCDNLVGYSCGLVDGKIFVTGSGWGDDCVDLGLLPISGWLGGGGPIDRGALGGGLVGGNAGPVIRNPPPVPQKTQPSPTLAQCLGASAKKNGVALALDATGALIPGASTAATLGKLSVGGAALVNSAVAGNLTGIGLGIVDFHLSSAGPLVEQYKNVSNVAKAVPFVGAIVSVTAAGFDVYSAYQDFQTCRAGK
jgi:RHS repeat-associated protein